ncbi:ABC-type transport auxiliary lipoprotein family protein [Chthonobacter albigriseus]|uniref:ABC-type transport auxiliary lipoprotein family protein n=1 Tax=Chthonobacter albigriseus TaxID=1683161 RepID=UPI0015EE877C
MTVRVASLRPSGLLRAAAALTAAAFLSACASLGGGSPADIFDIRAPETFNGIGGRTSAQLLVPTPSALEALATNRVVVRPTPAQIAYYPKSTWSDDLPALVQTKLVRAFENSGKAKAVGTPGQSLAIDYQVIVDIRAFELDVAGGRSAHVALGVKLLDDRTGKVRATKLFEARVPARTDTATDAIAALDQAAGEAFTDIVEWTAGVI